MIEMRVILPTLVLLAAGVAQAVEPIYRMPSPRTFSGEIGDQMPVRDVGALTGAVTVTGWVKLGGWPDPKAQGRGLYTFFSGGDNFRCGVGANRKMFVLLDGKWISVTEEPFEVGGWTHFAFTWAPGRIELIANGRYLEVVAPAKGFPGPVRENLGFVLGSMNNWCPLKGELSDVKVYDRVLSLPEIEEAERDVVRRLAGATAPIAEVSRLRRTKALEAADREAFGGREFIAAPVPCTDAMEMYVPDMSVPTNVLGRPLNVLLTPGEYESASFVVRSRKPVTGLCPRLSPLTCGEASLPPSVCDFRIVKVVATCTGNAEQGIRALKPFVLVHDDAIMRVDGERLENWLRLSFPEGERYELMTKREKRGSCSADVDARKWPVRDAAEIRPLDLPARHTLQYYVTFRVPEGAKPGLYRGTLAFDGVPGVTLPVNVRVLPYSLPKPMTKWDPKREFVRGTYYRQHGVDFSPDAAGGLSPVRNERQFRAELRNLREHGFNMCSVVMALHVPMCHWKCGSGWNAEGRRQGVEAREPTAAQREHFTRVVNIMREEGMLTDPMYLMTSNLGFRDWYVRSEHRTEMTKAWRMLQRYAREILGHDRVVLYGVDEADGDCLRGEFDFWEDFRKIGGRIYTTGSLANIPLVIGRIETDIAAGRPRKDYAAKMHAAGGTMWTYANPQTYQKDDPRLFRINYGMDLYLADYDGFCTYAHNENVGNPWTDTDGAEWAFVIQTADGVVDTPSYEGYREAIDDIRYATKLQMEIERALAGSDAKARETARAARAWLDAIHVDMVGYDPEWIRWQIVEWTLELMGKGANPLFDGWYADPQIRAFGKEYWIFPTYSHEFAEQTFLDAFSSTDLKTWTKHGRILSTNEIAWARGCFWAPDAQEKDGRYYLFFSANNAFPVSEKPEEGEPQKEPGIWKYGGIGVAVAERPEGPYRDLIGKPLVDRFWNAAQPIDQYVFSYRGDWYMVYGGWRKCNLVRLAPDFKSLMPFADGRMWHPIDVPDYVEGSVMFERRGVWYFMYSSGAWTRDTYNVRYCTAETPFGPFTFRGRVLSSQRPLATGAGHHSVLCVPGTDDWYICYHRRPIPNESPHHRVTCLDRLYFNEDGTIRPVVMTD